MKKWLMAFFAVLVLGACNNNEDKSASGDHVWKTQTDALEKARQTGQAASDTAAAQGKRIEQESQ